MSTRWKVEESYDGGAFGVTLHNAPGGRGDRRLVDIEQGDAVITLSAAQARALIAALRQRLR